MEYPQMFCRIPHKQILFVYIGGVPFHVCFLITMHMNISLNKSAGPYYSQMDTSHELSHIQDIRHLSFQLLQIVQFRFYDVPFNNLPHLAYFKPPLIVCSGNSNRGISQHRSFGLMCGIMYLSPVLGSTYGSSIAAI